MNNHVTDAGGMPLTRSDGLIHLPDGAARLFPEEPFGYRHGLAGHPLFTLQALADLAGRLDRDRVEYNSGRLNPNQRPEDVPAVSLAPAEVVRQIETAGAWMVLKNVETVPEYRSMIEIYLNAAARALGRAGIGALGMADLQGFIFVSSANATTPFHLDYEENFFVHIHGEKVMHIFDNRDRSLVSEEALETYPGKHRNLPYREEWESGARVFAMQAGEGLFLPYTWPHWVRTGNDWSVSMAITWKSKRDLALNRLYFVNAVMRKAGLPQSAPGCHPIWDAAKSAGYRLARAAIDPLRRSEGMRRRLRQMMFGSRANYYYRDNA